jgi:hypothetical protein
MIIIIIIINSWEYSNKPFKDINFVCLVLLLLLLLLPLLIFSAFNPVSKDWTSPDDHFLLQLALCESRDRIIFTHIRLPYKTTVSFSITFTSQTDEVQSGTDHTGHEAKSVHFVVASFTIRIQYGSWICKSVRRQTHASNIPHDTECSCSLSLCLSHSLSLTLSLSHSLIRMQYLS